ncbi:MAG: helix-turn-helix domain-containing protein [Kofleriaceae bacterium]
MKAVANANLTTATMQIERATPSREFLERQAFEAFRTFVVAFQRLIDQPIAPAEPAPLPTSGESDVMTADEVAAFLGVDRNTVYDFAGRGVIPHQRLGKRLLFRRGAVVSWLDSSLCKATSTRKAG